MEVNFPSGIWKSDSTEQLALYTLTHNFPKQTMMPCIMVTINYASHIRKRAMIAWFQFIHLVFQSFKTTHTIFAVSLVCRKYWLTFNTYPFLLGICTSPVLNIAEEQVFVIAEVHGRVTMSFWKQGLAVYPKLCIPSDTFCCLR